ncbi:hypothetical protein pmac_cds_582 [Pandoravirus macleodensis]|uniref:Uncharacterized protein n=1 Tax=Pandoravirus macleodensis TaxID=2107707 RepID=A0A2U7UG20_9VIRU|nr:hypothetical protein pmac_cds_582 [Pandoravirus macleodensis]AVK77270.1 hypothetical protein pmac_cds_582 [Pandoravirus macleodensis]
MSDSGENTPRPWHSIIAAGVFAAVRVSLGYAINQKTTARDTPLGGGWRVRFMAWHAATGPWAHITVDGIDFVVMGIDADTGPSALAGQ